MERVGEHGSDRSSSCQSLSCKQREWEEERCGASVSGKGAGTKEKAVRPLVHLFHVHRFRDCAQKGWLPCSRTHTVGVLKPIDGSSHSILPASLTFGVFPGQRSVS